MSKKGFLTRYFLIVKKLKLNSYVSSEELINYINNQFQNLQIIDDTIEVGLCKRTIQRDIKEIRNLFGISIDYSTSKKGYSIIANEFDNMNFLRMLDAFEIYNSCNISNDLSSFIFLEKRRPEYIENLSILINAIRNKFQIKFSYYKYWEEEISERIGEPLALKEFKNRWYVIIRDLKNKEIKTFALDRMTNLEVTTIRFVVDKNFSIKEQFKNCYGIICPDNQEPQEILLSFEPFQGKYIKSLPLHESQEIVIDNEYELQIRLKLYITHDFIMELLSFGDTVMVLKPLSLIDELIKTYHNALNQYELKN